MPRSCARTRHKAPRLRTNTPTGRALPVERYSTSPSGNRRSKIGVPSTGSTWMTPCVVRVTSQSTPFRRRVSPTEGAVSRVRSYSMSPFGNWITVVFVGRVSLLLSRRSPLLAGANHQRRLLIRRTCPAREDQLRRRATVRSRARPAAGVALPESCCATERRPATRALEAANGGRRANWFDRHASEVQPLASTPRSSVPRTRGELPSCGRPSRVTRQAPPSPRRVVRLHELLAHPATLRCAFSPNVAEGRGARAFGVEGRAWEVRRRSLSK